MWFSKLNLKAAALVLVGAVSAMAATTGISPMTFGDDKTDVNNWNYLTQYKLWGTDGIQLGNRPGFYNPEYFDKSTMKYPADVDLLKLGAVGTLKNLSSVGDGGWLDGPIVVGGNITNSGQNFEILTGPIRTNGSNAAIVRSGVQTCNLTASTGKCDPSITPDYRSNIKVPTLSGVTWGGSLSVGNNPDKRTVIDVSSACSGGNCDLYYSSIDFENDSRLVISIPDKHIARIFTKKLNLKTHPEIVVRDPNKGDLTPQEYKGNLVIYVDGDITFENIDNVQIMGTLVSNGTLTMKCNMIISGQFIANKIVIGNEIDAKNFTFTPVHPTPKLVIDNKSKEIKESEDWYTLDVVLDQESEKVVTFDYCFDFYNDDGSGVSGVYAGYSDVAKADASHKFPICNKGESEKGEIPVGKTKASGINIKALLDGLVEDKEALWFQVNNISGAELSSDYEKGFGYKIYIVSNDKAPTVSSELVAKVNEDTKYTFTSKEFNFQHATQKFASVIITTPVSSSKGTFLYDGKAVTKNLKIAVADIGKLTYQPAKDDFSKTDKEVYTTFKYKVVGDGAGDNTSIEYTATVNVIPVNDIPTTPSSFKFSVNENPTKDAKLGNVTYDDVTNEKSVDSYTFALVSDDKDCSKCFVLTSAGEVKVNGTQTFGSYNGGKDSYTLTAKVTDDAKTEKNYGLTGNPATSKTFTILISVNSQNHAPTISNQSFTLPEKNKTTSGIVNWTSSKDVGKVSAKDPDGDNLTFKVVDSGIPFAFSKNNSTLYVSDGSKLDYETKKTWSFKVSVTDPSGASATATITVNLEDVNEDPIPDDVKSEYTVNENTGNGIAFGTFTVTDNDAGDKLTYTLTGALTGAAGASGTLKGKTLADIFYVDEPANSSGKRTVSIRVKSSALLDYEQLYKASSKNASYPVKIRITDKASNSVDVNTKITVVDVNEGLTATGGTFYIQEHSPGNSHVCTKSYDEDCEDTDYGYVTGVDEDKYNKSFSTLTYSISTANTGTKLADSKSFEINSDDGSIYTASDAEFEADGDGAKTSYTFLVTVSDGTNSKDVSVTVKVVNIEEPPVNLVTEGSGRIREDAKNSTKAADFDKKFITDPDELAKFEALGNDVHYSIDATASGFGIFDADYDDGTIVLIDKTKIDFETLCAKDASCKINGTSPMFTVSMTASNAAETVSLNIIRNIEIVDVNEAPTADDLTATVDETIPGGTVVGTISASDPDKYASCKTGSHSCGFNTLQYSIVNPAGLPFEIEQNTGKIKLKKNERLRYVDKQIYEFEVKVSDRATSEPALSTTAKVTINIKDINEPSEFRVLADLYEVNENTSLGETFGDQIVTYDEDKADVCTSTSCKLTLTIKDNDACTKGSCAEDLFKVVRDGNTNNKHETPFKFAVKSDLDYEALYKKNLGGAIFNVTVTVKDAVGNETSQETQIRVVDENEEPKFTKEPYKFTISENVKIETLLGKVEAEDPDIYNEDYGTLYFSLDTDSEDAAPFSIDQKTGELFVVNNAKLDYETKNEYKFKVFVTDKTTKISTLVTVNIKNEDEGPEFGEPPTLYVDENTPKGTPVTLKDGSKIAIEATDDDCKNKHVCDAVVYSLEAADGAPNDFKAFSIDSKGFITVAKDNVLNYEAQDKYVVRVVATDGTNDKLTTSVDVTIYVNDVNDKPVYEEKEYVFEIHENAPKGEFVGSVVAEDEDKWSALTYVLSDYVADSKDATIFDIDSDGNIYLASKSLDFEKKTQYQIVAKATDNGKSYGKKIGREFDDYNATTLVTINIIDDPDEPKIEDDGKASYGIYEVTAENPMTNGKVVKDSKDGKDVCYAVSDQDEGQTATLVPYITDEGNTDADRLFDAKIQKDGSKYMLCLVVKNTDKLNYETIAHEHKIKIAVMDADKLTASVEKTINIVDVNEMPIISGNSNFSFYEGKGKDHIVGKLYPDDIDTSKAFTNNVFKAVDGDTDLFTITEDGKIKTLRDFDYEKESQRTFELVVSLSDKDSKNYPSLTTKTKITLTLKNLPEPPEVISKQFSVDENSEADVLIGVIEATDPDGDTDLLFSLAKESPYVIVKPNGEIRVREGAVIDYESMQKFTITVTVKDPDGSETDDDIVIFVNDVNEPPMIKPQEFTFPEDSKPGTKKGPIEATDPDTKNEKFSDLKFYPVEENDKFEIKTNGDIVLKGDLDYEKEKSYVIKVYVTDGEFTDTTEIGIKVGNVIEKSEVVITRVEAGDSVYLNPSKDKPIYTNKEVIQVEWKQDGKTMTSQDTLKEGCQYVIKSYKAPNKDVAGADTVEVCYSTAAPIVDIDADKIKVVAENIYTIVEKVDKKDSSVYVNSKTKDVEISVIDTAYDDDSSKYKDKFKVTVVLDTIAVSNSVVKDMVEVTKTEIALEKNPKTETRTMPIGDKTKVSYDKVVNGDTVTVSYFVDDKGDIIKTTVIDEKGKKTKTEVIEVSTVVDVKGKKVTVSYKADAETGKILYGDSEGNLMVEVPESSSSKEGSKDKDEVDLKTGVGAFTVTYDAKGEDGNKTTVSYVIDEKGKIVANEEGDRGYLVTYTYTNKYGNSADKSVFMVLDKLAPIVKILTPSEGDVVFANFVDVDWCIAVDGDEKNCVKQDTLNFQSLTKGVNTIKRIYRDKAGNETIAEINVMMKKAKDVNIELEKPMVIVSIDSVKKYYETNPPEENQRYSVSILNPKTQTEKEVVKGNADEAKKGSGEEPYPGYDGHIGPTVTIDMKLPIVSAVGGLATLDDIIINGDMVALDGVDADGSKKVSVQEYIKDYCSTEFQEELSKDYSKMTLYNTSARVTLWFYTTGGQFVDKYQFDYEIDDADFVDKAGIVKFFFEMKPDINGELRDKNGRLYGTGPYIVKTKVDIRSQQRCIVPPVTDNSKIGDVLKSSDEMLKRFGYRRPVLRGNERASTSAKKETKTESKKSGSKSKN